MKVRNLEKFRKIAVFEESFLQCLLRVRAPVSVCDEHRCVCLYVCVCVATTSESKKAKFLMVIFEENSSCF